MAFSLVLKRVYLPAADGDGPRVLADRLWPRGITKERARLTLWARDAAPSPELRRAFHREPERFAEFEAAYTAELDKNPAAAALAERCRQWLERSDVTLLYAARDGAHSNAQVLKNWLERHPDQTTTED